MAIFIDNVMAASIMRKMKERGHNSLLMETQLKGLIAKLASNNLEGRVHDAEPFCRRLAKRLWKAIERILYPKTFISQRDAKRIHTASQTIKQIEDAEITITREVFSAWLHDPEMLALLDSMDICTANKIELFDVLDCDLSGELEVHEVVSGIMKLRGPSEKSDIVAALLGVRYMTKMLQEVWERLGCADADGEVDVPDQADAEEHTRNEDET